MSGRTLTLVFILVALVSTYLVYTYYYGENTGEIITISPDNNPTKIRPKEPGGVVVANSGNIIYENLQQHKGKQDIVLQPEPEKPLNLIHQTIDGEKNADPIDQILSGIVESDYKKYQKHKTDSSQKSDDVILPEKIKKQAAQTKDLQDISNVSEQAGLNITKVVETKRKPHNPNLSKSLSQGKYKIQLVSVKTLAEAEKELERIKKKYSKALSKSKLTIKKIQYTKGKIFYIILAGEYKTAGEAKSICKKLSDSTQGCIIISQ